MPHARHALSPIRRRWWGHGASRAPSLVATLVAALVLGACSGLGGGADVEEDPQAALVAAFEELSSWTGIVVDLRLEADATARDALLEDAELSADDADTLFASSLRVTASGEAEDAGVTFAVIVQETELAEVRLVEDDRVFIRLDIETATTLADDADVEDFDPEELVLAARMFGAGDAAEALVAGDWVELIGIDDLAELSGEPAADTDDDVAPDEADEVDALVEQFAADMTELLEQDAEVVYVGSEDAGERVRVTAPTDELASVVDGFVDELADVTGDAIDEDDPQQLADDVGESVTIDVWVADGSVTQIGFDPSTVENAEPIEGELLIIAALAEFSGAIEAPPEAVEFDVLQIVGAFFGGLGAGGDPFGGDPFGDDAFGDDAAEEDALEDDPFEDDPFEDDPFEDDGSDSDTPAGDAPADDTPGGDGSDDAFGDPEVACISDDDFADIEAALGPDGLAEIEELIDAGLIERC